MLHYSCDVCKRPIHPHADVRHVVKIEVFPAVEDDPCGCAELEDFGDEADHLEEMQDLLEHQRCGISIALPCASGSVMRTMRGRPPKGSARAPAACQLAQSTLAHVCPRNGL